MRDSAKWEALTNKIRGARKQIRSLKDEIKDMRRAIEGLRSCENRIAPYIELWNAERSRYMGITLAPVSVESSFEGYSADSIAAEVLPTIMEINVAEQKVTAIVAAFPGQITMLNEEIRKLEEQISRLESYIEQWEIEMALLEVL